MKQITITDGLYEEIANRIIKNEKDDFTESGCKQVLFWDNDDLSAEIMLEYAADVSGQTIDESDNGGSSHEFYYRSISVRYANLSIYDESGNYENDFDINKLRETIDAFDLNQDY